MKRIEIKDFKVKINKERVLKSLGCFEGNSVYTVVSDYFDELLKPVTDLISPFAVAAFEDMTAYCLLTLGAEISDYSKSFFDKGEGMRGLLVNAMADECIFETDKALGAKIKLIGALDGFGVETRLAAPEDIPLSEQKTILEKTGVNGVGITDAFMYTPVKTLGYILKLTNDKDVFRAEHNCSECPNTDCPRRSVSNGNYAVLSEYDYAGEIKDGAAVCIDIGTTTVVFELITDKGAVRTYKTINPQRRFGLDVLSRIDAANRGRGDELASLMRYTLLRGFNEVTKDFHDVKKIVIAGNTTMVYLLMNYSCAELGQYPFRAEHTETVKTTFDRLTDFSAPPVETVIYGGISAFVGGDIVSGLYMLDFDKLSGVNMFIDLGTNGEMAIGNGKRIIAASAAAGPAFEGGRISCGTGSVDGAVCGVNLKSNKIKTIGNKPPVGICGTGIIELISELLNMNIIDSTGFLHGKSFKLTENIMFNQNDIRQIQTAKAAVRAGIDILMGIFGTDSEGISNVYLAGGFGHGLSVEKACNIGILPREFMGKTKSVGNSALGGCVKYCSQHGADAAIAHIKEISKEISLAQCEDFNSLYINNMNFTRE